MSYQPHATKPYERRCPKGHAYRSDDPAARYKTRAGQARYFCPACARQGALPPKGWSRAA